MTRVGSQHHSKKKKVPRKRQKADDREEWASIVKESKALREP
jgi:hypothetical protein